MTKEEKLKILLEAEDQALVALSNAEAGGEVVDRLLRQINGICILQDRLVNPYTCAGECCDGECCGGECCGNVEDAPTQKTDEHPTPVAETEAFEANTHAYEPAETETPTLSKDDVIRVLQPIQNSAPDGLIAGVMQEMGYINLSAIPAARYQELLDRVEAAVKAEEQ